MDQTFKFGNKKVSGRLVIPSGIRCTHGSTIDLCFREIESIGVVTTKSISLLPRPGYREPIYASYAPDSYVNAVGLANPGAKAFRQEVEPFRVPNDKFLLVSIFGGSVEEFVETARELVPIADGFELNMSCPHAKGYGIELGQDCQLVAEIVEALVEVCDVPVIVKLSVMVRDLATVAKASIDAGAAGITVTNSVGPSRVDVGETPILYNRVGGLSGAAIRPLGMRAVDTVRTAVGPDPIVIGMGGVYTGEHVRQFRNAGADLVGIGSALTGMNSAAMKQYFQQVAREAEEGKPSGPPPVAAPLMKYTEQRIVDRVQLGPDLFKIIVDGLPGSPQPGELAGKYYFLCTPGAGEKPFAIFSAAEKSIVVKKVGIYTEYLSGLTAGDPLHFRGPYGQAFPGVRDKDVVLVGGGTGIASLLEIAHLLHAENRLTFVLGGRSAADLFDVPLFEALGSVHLTTDDGTLGTHGNASMGLQQVLDDGGAGKDYVFVNCGPEPMIFACAEIQKQYAPANCIWGAVEYMTSCGVGICGKCASPAGYLTCIDGPFMTIDRFASTGCRCDGAGHGDA